MKPLRALHHGEEGFGLIVVIGMAAAVTLLIVAGTGMGIATLQSSRSHQQFEGAMAVAEAGVDQTLSDINAAYNAMTSTTFVTGGSCALTAPTPFASDEGERAWASSALEALPDECLVTTPTGQYVAVRPTGAQAVYSMGWTPSRDAAKNKKRLVKAEYLFAPYKPSNAILTSGDLDFSGSLLVDATNSGVPANVHTNADITGYNNSLNVAGAISSSGTLPGPCPTNVTGGCTDEAALQSVPTIKARNVYTRLTASNADGWYDLCPDGIVRAASTSVPPVPCTGSALGSSGFNGWQFTAGSGATPPVWTLPRTAGGPYPGTYYVFEGDAKIGDGGNSSTTWPITVIAEAAETGGTADTCGTLGGNIDWKLFNLTPKLPGMQLLADARLSGSANASAGSGLFLAGHTVELKSSSGQITGAVVASNECAAAGTNSVQGYEVHYDGTFESPLSDLIRTSLWLEYPAGS